MALRYWMHGGIEHKRLLEEQNAAGLDPVDPQVIDEMHADRESSVARRGTNFGNPYGWAADALGKSDQHFRDVEESVNLMAIDIPWRYK